MNNEVNIFEDSALARLVEESEIEPPEEAVEQELAMMVAELDQQMKLRMGQDELLALMQGGMKQKMEEFQKDAYRIAKTDAVLKDYIRRGAFEISDEELEREALAMSERLGMGIEVVRAFLGEDYGSLRYDLQVQRALSRIHEEWSA